jgi:hypothetical protein
MTINEMKSILAQKLASEGTYFTEKHISIRTRTNGYRITIEDYEHIPFNLTLEEDEYFGKCVFIGTPFDDESVSFRHSKKDYPIYEALLDLGYYIGSRF